MLEQRLKGWADGVSPPKGTYTRHHDRAPFPYPRGEAPRPSLGSAPRPPPARPTSPWCPCPFTAWVGSVPHGTRLLSHLLAHTAIPQPHREAHTAIPRRHGHTQPYPDQMGRPSLHVGSLHGPASGCYAFWGRMCRCPMWGISGAAGICVCVHTGKVLVCANMVGYKRANTAN